MESCTPCSPGTFSEASMATNASTCLPCGEGTVSPNSGADACIPCENSVSSTDRLYCVCQPGYFKNGSSCDACLPGSYSNSTDAPQCRQCEAGTFSEGPASTFCEACLNGTVASSGAAQCTPCSLESIPSEDGSVCICNQFHRTVQVDPLVCELMRERTVASFAFDVTTGLNCANGSAGMCIAL